MSQFGQLDRLVIKPSKPLLGASSAARRQKLEAMCRAVLEHKGNETRILKRVKTLLKWLSAQSYSHQEAIPWLLNYIASEKVLKVAWFDLSDGDKTVPGPDGLFYKLFTKSGVFRALRGLGKSILTGSYFRSNERVQWVPKTSGKGTRPIVVMSIFDRVVDKAAALVLGIYSETLLSPCCYGYRPGVSTHNALADAYRLYEKKGLACWVCVDLRDAFTNVPISKMLEVFAKYFPDDKLIAFAKVLLTNAPVPGLRQGSPLSPLMINLYLHHHLDKKWSKDKKPKMIRWADDILILCKTQDEAQQAYGDLCQYLRSTGMKVKETLEEAVFDIAKKQSPTWLGFEIEGYLKTGKRKVRANIPQSAWERLREKLEEVHLKPNSPIMVDESINAWLSYFGPALREENWVHIYEHVVKVAAESGFDELDPFTEWKDVFAGHRNHWLELKKSRSKSVGSKADRN